MNGVAGATTELIAVLAILLLVVLVAGFLQRRPKQLKPEYFQKRWKELQVLCRAKDTWPLAVINADKLLDEALKKRRFKGKAMGERLVAAQRTLTDNDATWFGHKLRNRLVHEESVHLREKDVKQALVGFRQALKDLGAL
jgi:hypothetical protein